MKMVPRIRKKESPRVRALLESYTLVLHAIAAIAVIIFMLKVIDGIAVDLNSGVVWYRRTSLQADDITTIVSAAIVALRVITGACSAKSAWRCALILLETQGITLRQFNRMVSWPVYFLRGSTDAYLATLIILLLVPANLVSPVINGSVGWKETARAIRRTTFQHASPAASDGEWYLYSTRSGPKVDGLSQSAASRAGVGWLEFGKGNALSSRHVTSTLDQRMSLNSTIENLTLPFIEIHSITWDTKPDMYRNITGELDSGTVKSKLTLTGERPFDYFHPGNAVLFDENFLDNYTYPSVDNSTREATIPPPTLFRGSKRIAVLVIRQDCSALGNSIFGNRVSTTDLKDMKNAAISINGNCFLLGTVNFTAGVIRKQGKFIAPRVVEGEMKNLEAIVANNWVVESLYLMPDVMRKVSMFNVSQIPTWNNLDGYLEDLIRISYQATWCQVTAEFNSIPLYLPAHQYARKLQAVVSIKRVIGWYCAQFLVLVSAALLRVLQKRSKRPLVNDPGVVALLVDAAPILNKYDAIQELSGMSYVTAGDGGGTVRLLECDVSDIVEQARLVGRYDSKRSETPSPVGHEDPSIQKAPQVEHDESSIEDAKPLTRYMLVPQTD